MVTGANERKSTIGQVMKAKSTISRLTPRDAAAYRDLMLHAYQHYPEAFTTSYAERCGLALAFWESRLSVDAYARETVLGAWVDGKLVGLVGLAMEAREKTLHKATLFGMFVTEQHRGHGLGSQLVAAILNEARARPQLRIVQLTVTDGNTAKSLYERHGFKEFGLEPYAVAVGTAAGGTGYVGKWHMWCELK